MSYLEELTQDAPLDPTFLARLVAVALDEDLGPGPGLDVTTFATIPAGSWVRGDFVARADGVVAGLAAVAETVAQVTRRLRTDEPSVTQHVPDGTAVTAGTPLVNVNGPGPVV